MKPVTILIAAVLALASTWRVSAQSLGDVARQEEARRKGVAKPGKVYTNESLRGSGDVGAQANLSGPATAAPAPDAKPESAPQEKDPKKEEAYWRDRVTKARDGLERTKTFKEALQTRINSLSADFTSRDDPAQRAAIAADRQKVLAELERVTKEIADFEKQLRDIEDEARKAGVPPGWVR
jgi:uncharacterized protein (DUF3084 family)